VHKHPVERGGLFERGRIELDECILGKIGVLLGDASYSIYLIHPLVFYYVYAKLQPPLPPIWSQEFLRFGSIAVVCLLTIASWKLFESPIIRLGNRLTNRTRTSVMGVQDAEAGPVALR
jgi:peptidoglycan/LPS O-acetylase OafA/YrhL